jgi:hypothetical protein
MKRQMLRVSVALLAVVGYLGGDSHMTCYNACLKAYNERIAQVDATYNSALNQAQKDYQTCTNPLSSGTTYGGCLAEASKKDCEPKNSDGSCKDPAALAADIQNCSVTFLGTGSLQLCHSAGVLRWNSLKSTVPNCNYTSRIGVSVID